MSSMTGVQPIAPPGHFLNLLLWGFPHMPVGFNDVMHLFPRIRQNRGNLWMGSVGALLFMGATILVEGPSLLLFYLLCAPYIWPFSPSVSFIGSLVSLDNIYRTDYWDGTYIVIAALMAYAMFKSGTATLLTFLLFLRNEQFAGLAFVGYAARVVMRKGWWRSWSTLLVVVMTEALTNWVVWWVGLVQGRILW